MEKVVLKALVREGVGKSACKHLRKDGRIPAVVYKDGKRGLGIQVDNKDLWHALHTEAGENVIITMNISGGDKPAKKTVIVKDIQVDPINEKFLHVDFKEISLKDKLKVKVPVIVKGEAAGVKEEEGVLSQILWEIEVECLPTEIPEHIEVHVEDLHINDSIHVRDIKIEGNIQVLDDPEQPVVTVSPPMKEEEEVVAEVPGEEAEEPEVIKKGKKEEEEAPEEEAAGGAGGGREEAES